MQYSLPKQIWQAFDQGTLVEVSDYPLDTSSAYAIQHAAQLASGQRCIGYKIGATTDEIMDMLGLNEPFHGPLFEADAQYAKAVCQASDASDAGSKNNADILQQKLFAVHQPRVESEFVFSVKHDLVWNSRDFTRADVEQVIDWVAPAFEFVGCRFVNPPTPRGPSAICDLGSSAGFIVGVPHHDWQALDLDRHPVTLQINGQLVASGNSGMSAAGNPIELLLWLVNAATFRSTGLKAGQLVSCGTCTGALEVNPGDKLAADYAGLGILEASIVGKS